MDNMVDTKDEISKIITVEITKLNLKPDDILVLKVPYSVNPYDIEELASKFGKLIPNEVRGIWMRDDIELEVITPEHSETDIGQ